jgi:protein SCO1/2
MRPYVFLAGAALGVVGLELAIGQISDWRASDDSRLLSALKQTFERVTDAGPLATEGLISTDGHAFGPERLRGRWTLVYLGYSACGDVCPTTLQVLSAVAKDPESGVATGKTALAFVSVDAQQDTAERMRRYLANFDEHIVGLTGARAAIERFSSDIGAAFQAGGGRIDHSTSLFVVNPDGRVVGTLLRPADPQQIIVDLHVLQGFDVTSARPAPPL